MNEPYIVKINGCNGLIIASCLSEAKYKAKRMNGKIVKPYNIEDYRNLESINKKLKHYENHY
jgi:hypothetical protein